LATALTARFVGELGSYRWLWEAAPARTQLEAILSAAEVGFDTVRQVAIDDWSALRFRRVEFIKRPKE
jgi:hypothetical protein